VAIRTIAPIRHAIDKRVRVPASKSVANRELLLAAIARGRSTLDLGEHDPGDDVRAMRDAIGALGCALEGGPTGPVTITGLGDTAPTIDARIDCGHAGTVARFVTALAATLPGRTRLDGSARLRERPIAPLARALRELGATVDGDALPLTVRGPLRGGAVNVPGHESSQFASALLLAAPRSTQGVTLRIPGSLVSAPFVQMTVAALERRDVRVERLAPNEFRVAPQAVTAGDAEIPGDVTAATYPAAAAALLGGRVTIENIGLGRGSGDQGDVRAFQVLKAMGCGISTGFGGVHVRRTGVLYGVRDDLGDISDTFPTIAVVAAVATGPSELLGLAHTRRQESDRLAAVAAGLRALGGNVTEYADGLRIVPAPLHGGVVDAAGDHRIAMAFAVLGLVVPGISIEGAGTVTKTYPGFYEMLAELAG
jgi:3-phosphoshikimate 1-carboxyvinyltransferase